MLIAHITKHLDADGTAFVHAAALSASSGASLVSLHAGSVGAGVALPDVGTLLRRWNVNTPHGEHWWCLVKPSDDPSEALLRALDELRPDLLVASTRARGGLSRLFAGSVAESLARNLCIPALILPADGPGFVEADSGQLHLQTLLIPVGSPADAQRAVDAAAALCKLAGATRSRCVLMHVSDGEGFPHPVIPETFTVTRRLARGDVSSAVVASSREIDADAIVMTSHGHDSLPDVLAESHTERVLHAARRPLLWVPENAHG